MKKSLCALREGKGLTQVEVSKLLGITPAAYCRKEKGVRPLFAVELQQLARIFGVSLDDIEICASNITETVMRDSLRPEESRT